MGGILLITLLWGYTGGVWGRCVGFYHPTPPPANHMLCPGKGVVLVGRFFYYLGSWKLVSLDGTMRYSHPSLSDWLGHVICII